MLEDDNVSILNGEIRNENNKVLRGVNEDRI